MMSFVLNRLVFTVLPKRHKREQVILFVTWPPLNEQTLQWLFLKSSILVLVLTVCVFWK